MDADEQRRWERRTAERLEDLEARRTRILSMRPSEVRDRMARRLAAECDAIIAECEARKRRMLA